MADIATCPRCGEECPARHITEAGCPSCNDEAYDTLVAENEWADDMRRADAALWADAR